MWPGFPKAVVEMQALGGVGWWEVAPQSEGHKDEPGESVGW